MTVFHDLTNTAAGVNAGFTFGQFASAIDAAGDSLANAALTVGNVAPSYVNGSTTGARLLWSNGTDLTLGYASASASSITINRFDLTAGDGAFFEALASGKITSDGTGGVVFSKLALTSAEFGSDQASQVLSGKMTIDSNSGAFSGKLTSMIFKWDSDNPGTPGHEDLYVKVTGSLGISGSLAGGITGVSGKLVGFEWGTMTTNADGGVSYSVAGAVTGLKGNAGTLLANLQNSGFDSLMAGLYAGNDAIDGTGGNDFIEASTGNDKVYGEDGNDHIDGGLGNDQLFGGGGDDTIIGGVGNDKIIDDGGNNTITDTEGNAQVITGWGNDTITTGAGNDKITAGEGNDVVFAGAGKDTIVTGGGNDWIYSGGGADKISAGAGADVFVFDNFGGKDAIADFNVIEDILAFDTSVFASLAGGITADNIVIGAAALDANDYLIFNEKGGKLYYDADGNGGGGAIEIANIKGAVAGMSIGNFADVDLLA